MARSIKGRNPIVLFKNKLVSSGSSEESDSIDIVGYKGSANFSIQVIQTGSGKANYKYLVSHDGVNFTRPSQSEMILNNFTSTSGKGGDGTDLVSLKNVPTVSFIKIEVEAVDADVTTTVIFGAKQSGIDSNLGSGYTNDFDWSLALAEGRIPNAAAATLVFGFVDDLDTDDGLVDMWDDPNKGNVVTLTTNTAMEVVSDNAADVGFYNIIGLKDDGNGNWIEVSDFVKLTGQTPVALTNTYERITFMVYLPDLGVPANIGQVTVRPSASPDDVQLYFNPLSVLSRKGYISLPTNVTYLPELFQFSISSSSGSALGKRTAEISLVELVDGVNYQELVNFRLDTDSQPSYDVDVPKFFQSGVPVRKKRELKFRAKAALNDVKISATIFSWQKIKET